MSSSSEITSDTSPWETLLTSTAIQALVSMAALISPVLTPLIIEKVGGTASILAGTIASLTYLGAAIFTVISGPLIYKWGAIRISQVGMLICATGLAIASTGSYFALLTGAFIIGMGNGPITPASSHILAKTTPARRLSLVFSVKQTGVPLGGLSAGAIGPIVGVFFGWQVMLVSMACVCVAFSFFSERLHRRLDTDAQPDASISFSSILEPAKIVLQNRILLKLALCSMAFTFAQLTVSAYSVTYLKESVGMSIVTAGLFLSVAQVGGVFGRVGWGYIADSWLGGSTMLTVLAFVMACCSVVMSFLNPATPEWLVAVLMAVFGATAIGWNGVLLAQVARFAPKGSEGKATSGTLLFTFTGNVVGPMLLTATIHAFDGMKAAYMLLAVPICIAAAALLLNKKATNNP
ncbi:MFS transporter [Comamonas testosteroni]|nr:MFS transporter [Comamonas testosteroni]